MRDNSVENSSFRDPSGFVFYKNGEIYRQINAIYKDHYDHFMNSGLYEQLKSNGLIIPHEEISCNNNAIAYKLIKPVQIGFISYPFEWSFSQLKYAALTTLHIQKIAFEYGMVLKDCSAYNIQFMHYKPVFIDTLSFEKYTEGRPWVAYKQFCQHFFAPLALMCHADINLQQLLRVYIDGIPLDLASRILSNSTYLNFSILSHIHVHSKGQKFFADKEVDKDSHRMKKLSFLGLVDSLETGIKKLKWEDNRTQWGNYYNDTNYSSEAFLHKKEIVQHFLEKINPDTVWDLGANTGEFSRIASEKGIPTISFDIDPAAVEQNYIECVHKKESNILPLLLDLTNPSSSIGWANKERRSLLERGPADTVLALALIHHLAITNNLPLKKVAHFFQEICNHLLIEFVPKNDSQVRRLLSTREDIFSDYTQERFENDFQHFFSLIARKQVKDSERTLFLFAKRK